MKELPHKDMIKILDEKHLDQIFQEHIWDKIKSLRYEKGETVVMAGNYPKYLSIVVRGRCEVRPLSKDGKEIVLNYLYPGSLIGDVEIIEKVSYLHSVYADTETDLICVPKKTVEEELMGSAPFLRFMLELTTEKLLEHSNYFYDTRLFGFRSRFCKYVIDMAAHLKSEEIPFIMTAVAKFIGVSERQLRRIINDYEKRGILKKKGRHLLLIDVDALRQDAQREKD